VCATYTAQETHHAVRLSEDIHRYGHEMDLVRVQRPTTKPWEILLAMDRNPGQMICMLDIDARIEATLDELSLLVTGDIAMYFKVIFNHRGRRPVAPVFSPRTSCVVAQDTPGARRFLGVWDRYERLRYGQIVWSPASLAMSQSVGVTFSMLPVRFAANRSDGLLFANVRYD